jgi:NADP-dependent alcohol dehydrogenase
MMDIKRENKKEKLLQYAERVWKITKGTEDERIDAAIRKTVEFFESLGIKTKLSDYGVGEAIIQKVVDRFVRRGMIALGERGDLTPQDVAKILKHQLN